MPERGILQFLRRVNGHQLKRGLPIAAEQGVEVNSYLTLQRADGLGAMIIDRSITGDGSVRHDKVEIGRTGQALGWAQDGPHRGAGQIANQQHVAIQDLRGERASRLDARGHGSDKAAGIVGDADDADLGDIALDGLHMNHAIGDLLRRHDDLRENVAVTPVPGGEGVT